jgi:peptidoglycan/LPS O-acetylase OafA/YrhL
MSFAVAELLVVNLFRQRGWVPAAHPVFFSSGMLAVMLGLALALHRAVESPARRRADRLMETAQVREGEGFFL